ncbi:MAG: hypothetical protein SGILL_009384 [Bacillariaceae sp.]
MMLTILCNSFFFLFRALKAIVLPLVFVNVVIACVDMMLVGAAGGIGGKSVGLYLATTVIAASIGSVLAFIFSGLFHEVDVENPTENSTFVSLGCSGEDHFLAESADGSITCTDQWVEDSDILWEVSGANGSIAIVDSGAEVIEQVGLSNQFYNGIFLKLIPDNIFEVFVEANFAAMVVFAIAAGVAVAKLGQRMKVNPKDTTFMSFLMDTDQILMIMISWIIFFTPFAVFSMIAASIGVVEDLGTAFANVGLLVACTFCGFIVHFLFTYCGGMFLLVRINPFTYLKYIIPAQLVAFATGSSAVTIPVNIESTIDGGVPESISKFLVPLGATINMDGTAIYYPCACIWLAIYNGITPNVGDYVLLAILSTFGSIGTAPVPNSGIVMIATAYQTAFNTTTLPLGFSFLFAIDWLIDRVGTALNVTGDAVVARVITKLCPLDGQETTDLEGGGSSDTEDESE